MSDIYDKFNTNFTKLTSDIQFIESKISEIQDKITGLDLQITNILNIINTVQGAERAKIYGVYNELMKLLSAFYSNLSVLIDLRQKYRSQEGDLKYKSVRLIEFEMKKIEENTVSHDSVLKSIQNMNIENLFENDEKYKI